MEKRDSLIQIVSELLQVEPGRISSDLPLTGKGMQGSLARTRLDAAIRKRIGIRCPAVYTAKSFGDLEIAIFSDSAAPEPPATRTPVRFSAEPSIVRSSPMSCGIDIEDVGSLPAANDYREDEFYKSSFTPTEIAYCVLQENPRMHFAARWCAKEALKKCDPTYLDIEMSAIELVSVGSETPYLAGHRNGQTSRLPFAVSVSHTNSAAVALVVRTSSQPLPALPEIQAQEVIETQVVTPATQEKSERKFSSTLLAFFAFGLAAWALIRTFL